MDVGPELRVARERRGLSIQQIADRTKISLSVLRAIESDDLEQLPPGVFARGFLKAYAREVGVDPAPIVEAYSSQFEHQPQEPATDGARPADDDYEPLSAYSSERSNAVSTIVTLALVAVGYFAFSRWQTSEPPKAPESPRSAITAPSTVDSSDQKGTATRPMATAGSFASSDPTASSQQPALQLDVEPTGDCWITASADGTRVAYTLMHAGERQAIQAKREIILRVGDAGAFRFSINGKPGRPIGSPGEIRNITITPDNYHQFLGR